MQCEKDMTHASIKYIRANGVTGITRGRHMHTFILGLVAYGFTQHTESSH